MDKTVSVRMDAEDHRFVKELAEERREGVSTALRELVERGRLMLAIRAYKDGSASLGRAAELAGVSVSEMIDTLAEFGVETNLGEEEVRESLEHLRRVW